MKRWLTITHSTNMLRLLSNFIWLLESRTPEVLRALTSRFPSATQSAAEARPLLLLASATRFESLQALDDEREAEREADRIYWEPLKRELEQLRHSRR